MKKISLLNAVLEPRKIKKVSSQLQVSHVFVFSLHSIVISVPDPLIITTNDGLKYCTKLEVFILSRGLYMFICLYVGLCQGNRVSSKNHLPGAWTNNLNNPY